MIEKRFDVTFSHKMPTGDIISVRFGTTASVDVPHSEEAAKKLFNDIYKATMQDIKLKVKRDKFIRTAYKGSLRGIKKYETEQEAIKLLEDGEDE